MASKTTVIVGDIGQATTAEKVAQTAIAKFGLSLSEGSHETAAR